MRQAASQPRINFHKLETDALRKYRRFYKLPDVGPNSSKDQLVAAVGRHFMSHVSCMPSCNSDCQEFVCMLCCCRVAN